MRINSVLINGFRVVAEATVPIAGMTVLVGPNAIGKTTLLAGVEAGLALHDEEGQFALQVELDDEEDAIIRGRASDLVDPEFETHRSFSVPAWDTGDGAYERTVAIIEDLRDELEFGDADEVLSLLAKRLIDSCSIGEAGDRKRLVDELLRSRQVIVDTDRYVYRVLTLTECTRRTRDAVLRVASSAGDSGHADVVASWCKGLVQSRPAVLPVGRWEFPESGLTVVRLASSIEQIQELACELLIEAHDRTYCYAGKMRIPDPVLVSPRRSFSYSSDETDQLSGDAWLEILPPALDAVAKEDQPIDDAGRSQRLWELVQDSLEKPDMYDTGVLHLDLPVEISTFGNDRRTRMREWSRVKPTLLKTALQLSDDANRVAPSFIRELGTIVFTVLPSTNWRQGDVSSRVKVGFVDAREVYFDIGQLSEGVQRWILATVQLLRTRLDSSERVFSEKALRATAGRPGEPAGGVVDGSRSEELDQVVEEARRDPFGTDLVSLNLGLTNPALVWLVDEPEAHLHVGGVRSVVDWLLQRSREASGVIVATHSNMFLTIDDPLGEVVLGQRGNWASNFKRLERRSVAALRSAAPELGLSGAEILGRARLFLFVEGPHDQAVLDEFIGDDLANHGVIVLPMHGTKSGLTGLVESELIAELEIPIGSLTDETSPENLSGGTPRTRTERAIDRLRQEARAAGREVHTFGLRRRDIVDYLDDAVCAAAAPGFPGWESAADAWKAAGRTEPFKKWVTARYGLRLDRQSVRDLARSTKDADKVPKEFQRLLREILAATNSSGLEPP